MKMSGGYKRLTEEGFYFIHKYFLIKFIWTKILNLMHVHTYLVT